MNTFINRIFGSNITSVSLKDVLDKLEAYLGICFLLVAAAIEWSIIQLAAQTEAPGALEWMIPVNSWIVNTFGYTALVWLVKGTWFLANLMLFTRKGKSFGIVPMAISSFITYEYGNCTRFPWMAFGVVLLATGIMWIISIKRVKPPMMKLADDALEEARLKEVKKWVRIRQIALVLTVFTILIAFGQTTNFGVKLVVLLPLVLRAGDLLLKYN